MVCTIRKQRFKNGYYTDTLKSIYDVHGQPKRLQSDYRGKEFFGAPKEFCRQRGITMCKSRPYHPQVQGKVACSHRQIRAKIAFDLLMSMDKNDKECGVNWVENLGEYNRVINEEPRMELGGSSNFEVYYGSGNLYKIP